MKFFVVGLVREGEKKVQREIENLMACFSFPDSRFFVVESDSTDNTIKVLESIKHKYSEFDFISLGQLSSTIPERVSRITLCRNEYLRRFYEVSDSFDYLVVADLDGVNRKLTKNRISQVLSLQNWSMVSANQLGPYYDLWALRATNWLTEDCHHSFKRDLESGKGIRRSFFKYFVAPMFPVARSGLVEVTSAFGGLAIYRREDLVGGFYSEFNHSGEIQCEHVNFNSAISNSGGKLYISTELYNAGWTSNAKRALIRFLGICIFGTKYFKILGKKMI